MTGATSAAKNNDARLGLLNLFGDGGEYIVTREKPLGRRWDFGGLAGHRASAIGFSHG
jgi:hypothetical protein